MITVISVWRILLNVDTLLRNWEYEEYVVYRATLQGKPCNSCCETKQSKMVKSGLVFVREQGNTKKRCSSETVHTKELKMNLRYIALIKRL